MMMEIRAELEDISPVKKKLRVEIPAEVAVAEFNQIASQYRKHARLPGFRPGRAPVTLVKRRYNKDIRQDVLQKLIPTSYDQAIREQSVRPLGQLKLEHIVFNEGEALVYEAVIETLPVVNAPEYRGLEIRLKEEHLDQDSLEKELERLREHYAPLVSVQHRKEVQDGDHALVNLVGEYTSDAPPEEWTQAIKEDNTTIKVGDEHTHEDFNKALIGMSAGAEKNFLVDYAADYPEEKLAGRQVRFSLQLNDIKVKELPELNDEFAKDLGEFENLDQLKEKIREGLANEKQRARDSNVRQQLLQKLIEATDFPVPEVLLENRIDDKIRALAHNMSQQGMDPSKANLDWSKIRTDLRSDAEKETRAALILSVIAEKEQMKVPSEEFEAELQQRAESANQPLEKIKQAFQEEGRRASLEDQILRRKALAMLTEQAKIIEE